MTLDPLDRAIALALIGLAVVIAAVVVAPAEPEFTICLNLDNPEVLEFFESHPELTEKDVRKMIQRQFARGRAGRGGT